MKPMFKRLNFWTERRFDSAIQRAAAFGQVASSTVATTQFPSQHKARSIIMARALDLLAGEANDLPKGSLAKRPVKGHPRVYPCQQNDLASLAVARRLGQIFDLTTGGRGRFAHSRNRYCDQRFVVTSIPAKGFGAPELYEKVWCAHGDMETRTSECSSTSSPTAPRRQPCGSTSCGCSSRSSAGILDGFGSDGRSVSPKSNWPLPSPGRSARRQ